MVKGILADVHMGAYVDALVRRMTSDYWIDFWKRLNLQYVQFDEVGLSATSTDLEIWHTCQAEQLILVTNNRNEDTEDSLAVAIRDHNSSDSLPVFTIGDLNRLARNRMYAEEVVEKMFDHMLDIDRVRGAGRLYLP